MSERKCAGGYLAFDYLYRDASNYKAFGTVWLTGNLSENERDEMAACCDGGEFFIAEQIGIPALYATLFEDGGGPMEDDHAWHLLEGFRPNVPLPNDSHVWGEASALLAAFLDAKGNWRPELSPNFI